MPQILRAAACVLLLSLGVGPALSQYVVAKPKSPAEIAAPDKLAMEKRESCKREARAQKLTYVKRRSFVKGCLKR